MENHLCPLCKSNRKIIFRSIDVGILERYYKRMKINIRVILWDNKELLKIKCPNCGVYYFDKNIEGDSSFYEDISNKMEYYAKEKPEYDKALDIIIKYMPKSILEIWCAKWFFLDKIKNMWIEVYWTELNKEAIEICQQKWINIVNFEDNKKKYDMIISFQVLEHINNAKEMVESIYNNLNEGWITIISVPNSDWYLKETFNFLDVPPHHLIWWTKQSFLYLKNYWLELIDYIDEDLWYYDFLLYIQNLQIWKKYNWIMWKFIWKIQESWLHFIWPAIYSKQKFDIKWHTHMWVFRKISK